MTDSNMKHINRKIKAGFIILAVTLLSTACVSSPGEKQPEAIEVANSALSTGVGHYNDNKHELAISYFKNALRDFRSIDHQFGIASSSLNLSKSHLSTGNTETAEAYLEQAKRIIEREDIKQLSDHLSIIESSIAIENNQLAQAKEILQPLLRKRRQLQGSETVDRKVRTENKIKHGKSIPQSQTRSFQSQTK